MRTRIRFSQSLDKPRFKNSFQTERNLWTFLIIHAPRSKPSQVAGQEASRPWLFGVSVEGISSRILSNITWMKVAARLKKNTAVCLAHMKGNWQGKSLAALCLQIPVLLLVLEHLQPRTLGQKGKVRPCWWKGGLSKFICPQQSTYSFSRASFGKRTRESSEYAKVTLRGGWSCKFRGTLTSIGCSANSLKKKQQHKENGSTPKTSWDEE